jgi:hypothetical protein
MIEDKQNQVKYFYNLIDKRLIGVLSMRNHKSYIYKQKN